MQKSLRTELFNTYKLALPIIISQLGVILMATSDNVIVGRLLGSVSLGAAGVANSVAFLIGTLAVGGMAVVAPMVSKLLAEKQEDKIASLFFNTLIVALLFSVVLSAIGALVYQHFHWFGQRSSIETLSAPFFLLITISNVPLFFFLAIKQFSDGYARPGIVMYITLLGLVFDVVGNVILIRGWWIFPELGLNGAAIGTVFSRILMVGILFFYIKKNKHFHTLFFTQHWKVDRELIKHILQRSIPAGFQSFFEIAAFSFAVIMMGWLSETELAAHQIAINVASTTYMMATGFAYAGSIRIGEAWGNKDQLGIRLSGQAAYLWVLGFMSVCSLLIFLFGKTIIGLYIDDHGVLKAALPLLMIAAFFQLSDGAQAVGLGVLRGLADVKIPTYITFVAYWIISLPVGYYLGFHQNYGAEGIWFGLLLGLSFSAIFLYVRYLRVRKKLLQEQF